MIRVKKKFLFYKQTILHLILNIRIKLGIFFTQYSRRSEIMSSIQNLGCSTPVGFAAAVGTAGCLFQAGKAVNNAVQDGGSKTSMQRGLDNLLGEATSKASHVARNVFEGAVYTAGAVVLGGVAANAFDPEGNTVPASLRLFGSCSVPAPVVQEATVEESPGYIDGFMNGVQNLGDKTGISSFLSGVASVVSSLCDSTLGAADRCATGGAVNKYISNNPMTSAGVLVGGGVIKHYGLTSKSINLVGQGLTSAHGALFPKPVVV